MPLQWLENAYIMRRVAVRTMHSAFFRLASCPRHRTIKPDPLPTMNRNRYRLVFNRHRMQPMAVAECVATHAGESGSRCGAGMVARLPRLCALAAALQLWLGPAVAQIVASSDAPGHQRATVLDAGNGVPLVNVQSPSAAGVSRNTYSRFDVQAQGAILNNSRTAVGTHLAGGVAGNPWMAKGTARIIVNEVVSADPSRLRGIIEVAGDRAEVVIANPAGIDVDGAGFINASRATLTTGVPEFRDGALEGYRVERGRVRIEAGGLDASDTAYADILARAVEVNGAIHASELTVITGANRLSADLERVEPVEGSREIPAFALDVAELGGMYAGKIRLIGTEAGVGVRNVGALAGEHGELTLTADGRLENRGQLLADGDVRIDSGGDIDSVGRIQSIRGSTTVRSRGRIRHEGVIAAAADVEIQAIGPGAVIEAGSESVIASGVVVVAGAEGSNAGVVPDEAAAVEGSNLELLTRGTQVALSADDLIAVHGQVQADEQVYFSASAIDVGDSTLLARVVALHAIGGPQRPRGRRGGIDASGARLRGRRITLDSETDLLTDGADIRGDRLEITARSLGNEGGNLVQEADDALELTFEGPLDNRDGLIFTPGVLDIESASLVNDGGAIRSDADLTLNVSGHTDNGGGLLAGEGVTRIDAGTLENAGGIGAGVATRVTVRGNLDNSGWITGPVSSGGSLGNSGRIQGDAASGADLDNRGRIDAGARAANRLDNHGTIGGSARAGRDLANAGTIVGSANAGSNLHNSGTIAGDAHAADSLANHGHIVGGAWAADIDNGGTIAGSASAVDTLVNAGRIRGFVQATDIVNEGLLDGGVLARAGLFNSGRITTDAIAGTQLTNSGTIDGAAFATDLLNLGEIGGSVVAAGSLANVGLIFGDAYAGGILVNGVSGSIGGDARAGVIDNRGIVFADANAGDGLANLGVIAGNASAATITNRGDIDGSAQAGRDLDNDGRITGTATGTRIVNRGVLSTSAEAVEALRNEGLIGGDVRAAMLSNDGVVVGNAEATMLDNRGEIGGDARADRSLVNEGIVLGRAQATNIANRGVLFTSVEAVEALVNEGLIGGDASAVTIANDGEIQGSASAGQRLTNRGIIAGDARAEHGLANQGLVLGSAHANVVANGGVLATSAEAVAALENEGLIGGDAGAGVIVNRGAIGGDATATNIANAGDIAGTASAGAKLVNDGTIFGGVRAGTVTNRGRMATSAEALEALVNEGLIEQDARAGTLTNRGSIGGDAAADTRLANFGTIGANASAGEALVNHGRIRGNARAGQRLTNGGWIGGNARARDIGNGGRIGGSARASHNLSNQGRIGGTASAGARLANRGAIGGNAGARVLDNSGFVAGNARAAASLDNRGHIGGDAAAGTLSNGSAGLIGGAADSRDALTNHGTIVGAAHAGSRLTNDGAIGGTASATGALTNRGDIHGSASAAELGNHGWIGQGARATHTLSNHGTIEGLAEGQDIDNAGTLAGGVSAANALDNVGQISGNVRVSELTNRGLIEDDLVVSGTLTNQGTVAGSIHAGIIDNAGVIGAAGLAFSIHSDALSNRGAITGAEALFAVGRFDNTGGTVSAGRLGLWADQLTNGDGSITSAGHAILSVRDSFDNRNGRLAADGALAVLDSGSLSLMNAGGEIRGDGVLIDAIHTDSAGLVRSEASFTLYTQDDLSLGPDDLLFESAEHARLQVGGHFANEATVHAGQSLSVEAASLENRGHLGSDGISVLRIDGALVNHGEITGQTLSVSAGRFANHGELRARDLELLLRGDAAQFAGRIEASGRADLDLAGNLDLQGGSIHGDTVELTVGGDVSIRARIRTETDTSRSRDFDAGTVTTTESLAQFADSAPTLSATGELRLRVGGDFSARGATIGAGGNFDGLVAGAIDVTALTLASQRTGTTYGRYRYDEPGTRERQLETADARTALASELTAGGSLSLIAGGSARYQGSTLAAGETLTLGAAGGALELSALALTDTESLLADRLDELADVSERHQRQHATDTMLTAEQLVLVAGTTLTVRGAELSAVGDITAIAGGDISVASLSLTESRQRSGIRSDWVDVGDGSYLIRSREEYDSGPRQHQLGGRLDAGGDITIAAGLDAPFGDDLLTRFGLAGAPTRDTPGVLRAAAVTLTATGDVSLSAVGGLAAADSVIEAGGSLGLESGRDLALASVTLAAETDLSTQAAGHLVIEGGRHSRQPLALQRDAAESGVEAADPLAALDAPRAREHIDPEHTDRFARTGEGRFSAGGRLTLAAGGTLLSSGSDYTATEFIAVAGGDLTIAGSKIIEEAITRNGRERHTRIQAVAARIDADTVTIQGVGRAIEAEDGQTATTESTVHLDHVAIQSRGTAHVSATGDIAITPGAEFEHDYRHRKSSGLLSKRVRIDERTALRAATSGIDAGTLVLEALGDVSLTATRIAIRGERSEGDQTGRPTESRIIAGGDILYAAMHDQETNTHFDKKSFSLAGIRLSERSTETSHEQLVALPTELQSEADVLSESGGDTTLTGTRIELGENVMTLAVGGTLRLEAAYDLERTQEVERSFTLGGLDGFDPKLGKNTEDTTIDEHSGARATQIDAGAVAIETGGDLMLAGADIRADDNLDLAVGGDIVQQDAASTRQHFAEQRTSYIGSFVNTSDGRVHDFGVSTQRSKGRQTETSRTTRFNTLTAGDGTLTIHTGGDADLTATHLSAGGDLVTAIGATLTLGGASDTTSSGWQTQDRVTLGKAEDLERATTTASRVQASRIEVGGRFDVAAETVAIGAVQVSTGEGAFFDADAIELKIETDSDFHQFEQKDNDWSYTIGSDQGHLAETAHRARFDGGVDWGGSAPSVQVAVGDENTESFRQQDLRAQFAEQASEPDQGWIASLAQDPATHFEAVNTVEQRWDVGQQGLTQEGTIAVATVAAVFTGGAAASWAGGAATAQGAVVGAGAGSLAATSAVSFANSGGDFSAVLDAWGDDETWRQAGAAMLTAGLLNAQLVPAASGEAMSINQWASITNVEGIGRVASAGLSDLGGKFGAYLARGVVNAGVETLVHGTEAGSFVDLFRDSVVLDFSAAGAHQIGTSFGAGGSHASPALQTLAHAGLGCLSAAARDADCGAGALGGAGESVVGNVFDALGVSIDRSNQYAGTAYQVGNELFARGAAGELGLDQDTAQGAARNSAVNNFLMHYQQQSFAQELASCNGEAGCVDDVRAKYQDLSDRNNTVLEATLVECTHSGDCAGYGALVDASMPMLQGYQAPVEIDPGAPWVSERQNVESAAHNDRTHQRLLDRNLDEEIIVHRAVESDPEAYAFAPEGVPEQYASRIDQENAELLISVGAATASAVLPDPTDLFVGAVLVTKTGQVVGRVVEQAGEKFLWVASDLLRLDDPKVGRLVSGRAPSPVDGELVTNPGTGTVTSHVSPGGAANKPLADAAEGTADATSGSRLREELHELSRIQPDTSRDAWYRANTDGKLLVENKFDLAHVLAGDLKRDGTGSGYHAEFAADGNARIAPGAEIRYNRNDTYEAAVQIWNPDKINPATGRPGMWVDKVNRRGDQVHSTFFPPSWSEARIKYEVSEAFRGRTTLGPAKWSGTTPSGIEIVGYSNPNRTTFYPLGTP